MKAASCFVVLTLVLSVVFADTCAYALAPAHHEPDTTQQALDVQFAGQFGGGLGPIAVQGDQAYAGVGPRLAVLDVADPANPAVLGQTSRFPGLVSGVAVSGTYVYVTEREMGLHIVDISDPAQPVELGVYAPPVGQLRRVTVAGSHAYVAWSYLSPDRDLEAGVYIVDVSDPAQPAVAAIYDAAVSVGDMVVTGSVAYLADDTGMHILDVSDPAQPVEVGSYPVSPWVNALAVAAGYAYVAEDEGLHIVDVSDPAHPVELSVYGTPGWARDVQVAADYAYLADGPAGLHIVDVSDPTQPVPAGSYDVAGVADQVVLGGEYAYLHDGGVLRMVDVSDPMQPAEVSTYEPPGSFSHVAVSPGYAYVTGGRRLYLVDVSNPAQPAAAGVYDSPACDLAGLSVSGNYAYVAYRFCDSKDPLQVQGGLYIVDVSDREAPALVGSWDHWESVSEVVLAGDYAYLYAHMGGWMYLVDVSDPAQPFMAGVYAPPAGEVIDVAVAGNYAYVAYYHEEPMVVPPVGGVHVVDVSNPAQPAGVASFATWDVLLHVDAIGDYAYVLSSQLHIFDMSDPLHPAEVGADVGGHCGRDDLTVVGEYAYTAGLGALGIVRVADPAHPAWAGAYDRLWVADQVAVLAGHACVADRDGGLVILQLAPFPFHHYLPVILSHSL